MQKEIDQLALMDSVFISLYKIDSCIRNGQFITAHREIHKIISDIGDPNDLGLYDVVSHLNRTLVFLQEAVDAYSENQKTMEALKRIRRSIFESMRRVEK